MGVDEDRNGQRDERRTRIRVLMAEPEASLARARWSTIIVNKTVLTKDRE